MQSWFSIIRSNVNLDVLNIIKDSYVCSPHRMLLKSPMVRSIVTKLRINNSILKSSKKIECIDDLFCPECKEQVQEDAKHFLFICPKYETIRVY
jgi:hypothetical protein